MKAVTSVSSRKPSGTRIRRSDYLPLVRFDGGWRIVNKVYTAERQ